MLTAPISHPRVQKLETFTEERSCSWVYEPYRGEPLEGPDRKPYVTHHQRYTVGNP